MYLEITERDVKALEVYLRLLRMPLTYCMERDLPDLKHWLDLTSGRFASRLKRAYPWLTNGEMNICCLQRMGYTVAEMSALLGVKEASVNRTVYRACERLNIGGNKQVFQTFIQGC